VVPPRVSEEPRIVQNNILPAVTVTLAAGEKLAVLRFLPSVSVVLVVAIVVIDPAGGLKVPWSPPKAAAAATLRLPLEFWAPATDETAYSVSTVPLVADVCWPPIVSTAPFDDPAVTISPFDPRAMQA